tara:strand:+ start:58 stop:315 length:258 start_codon:yes stop_codon:yes gene_type:complete
MRMILHKLPFGIGIKIPLKNRIAFFLILSIVPLLILSSPLSPLSLFSTEKDVIPQIGLTTGDIFTVISLTAAMLAIYHFLLKRRL